MAAVHTIRLRGAWEVTTGADGRTRHTRPFGRPRTLDPGERVWLVCDGVPGAAEVTVNDLPVGSLPAAGPFAADITDRLAPRNSVTFSVASPQSLGEVVLQIRGPLAPENPG